MISSTALLKTPKILPLAQSNDKSLTSSRLEWRQQLLLIRAVDKRVPRSMRTIIPALQSLQWFEACLSRSAVKIVRLDMGLGASVLKSYAKAGTNVGKRVFLHLPAANYLPRVRSPLTWRCKRAADWLVAAGLVVCLSPLLLLLAMLVWIDSPGSVFHRQWRVGYRGQLFKTVEFRTVPHNVYRFADGRLSSEPRLTGVGRWLRRCRLDGLPQLLNVLRGEMSLVGPQAWTVDDALKIEPVLLKRLNALPGLTGAWQMVDRSYLDVNRYSSYASGLNGSSNGNAKHYDLSAVNRTELDYLYRWNVRQDLAFLLLAIPSVVFRSSGA